MTKEPTGEKAPTTNEDTAVERVAHSGATKRCYDQLMQLEEALPSVMSQKLWQVRVPVKEKIEYLSTLAATRTRFWQTVYSDFPQAKGCSASANAHSITITRDSLINEVPNGAKATGAPSTPIVYYL